MGYPRILWQNRVIGATLTASAATSGYPVTHLNDWRDYYRWAASGANSYTIKVDCGAGGLSAQAIAICGHNLKTCGARWKLDGSDNYTDFTALQAYVTAADDLCVAKFFTQATYRYYRLTIDNNGGANFSPEIGMLFVGNYLEFPEYLATPFDPDAQRLHLSRAQGDTGRPLGTAVNFRERTVTVSFNYLTAAWVTATWLPFWNSHHAYPFVWCHDYENYASAAYFMEWDQDQMTIPFYNSAYRTGLTLAMRGLLEEA